MNLKKIFFRSCSLELGTKEGKISAQPHTTLCIQFLDRENNDKNNTLPWENRFVLQQDGTVRKFYPKEALLKKIAKEKVYK